MSEAPRFIGVSKRDNEGNIWGRAIFDLKEHTGMEILIPFGIPVLPIGA